MTKPSVFLSLIFRAISACKLTLPVNIRMFPETILHRLELVYTIEPLGFLLGSDETAKSGLEVFPTRALSHSS
jgi:hypothetical protein